jgi:hypothetical protein
MSLTLLQQMSPGSGRMIQSDGTIINFADAFYIDGGQVKLRTSGGGGGGGGNPGGANSQIQYRVNETTFGGIQFFRTDGSNPQVLEDGEYEIVGENDASDLVKMFNISAVMVGDEADNESAEAVFGVRVFGQVFPVLRMGIDPNGLYNGFLSEPGLTLRAGVKINSISNDSTGTYDLLWLDNNDLVSLTDYFKLSPGIPRFQFTDRGDEQTLDFRYTSLASDIRTSAYNGPDDDNNEVTYVSELWQAFDRDNTAPVGFYRKLVSGIDFLGTPGAFGFDIEGNKFKFTATPHINAQAITPDTTTVAGYLFVENAPGGGNYDLFFAAGTTVPTDGEAGFARGATFIRDGVGDAEIYYNLGTNASCKFRQITTA